MVIYLKHLADRHVVEDDLSARALRHRKIVVRFPSLSAMSSIQDDTISERECVHTGDVLFGE